MRIAYFADSTQIGGAERYLADLAAGVAAAGHDVTVLAPQDDLLWFVAATAPATRQRRLGNAGYHRARSIAERGARLAPQLPGIAAALRRAAPEVLHVSNGGYPGSDLCRLAALGGALARVPRRYMTVNSMPWSREDSQPALQAVVDRALWRSLDGVACPSRAVGEALVGRRGLPRPMLHHIRYGVREPAGAEDAVRLGSELAGDREPLVGMVSARNVPEKGYDVFVQALARAGLELPAVLVGPHPGARFLEQVAELGIADRLTIVGPVPAVNGYFHAIDVLVVPSTAEEAMPLVILEAMAAGKPVIGARLSGLPEAIVEDETGWLFAPGAVDEVAALLARAARERERLVEMGRAGRRRWRELFSPEAVVAATLALYTSGRANSVSR